MICGGLKGRRDCSTPQISLHNVRFCRAIGGQTALWPKAVYEIVIDRVARPNCQDNDRYKTAEKYTTRSNEKRPQPNRLSLSNILKKPLPRRSRQNNHRSSKTGLIEQPHQIKRSIARDLLCRGFFYAHLLIAVAEMIGFGVRGKGLGVRV